MTVRRVLVAAVVLLALATPTAAASPTTHQGLPATIVATAPSLHPEGVAWDPTRRAFLVGSIRHGTVSVVRSDGRVVPLVADPRMVSTFGLHVDAARGRLLVTYADMGLGERSTPQTIGLQSGVGIFDLRTGRPIRLVDLNMGPGPHNANDVAIDRRTGTAYVTDPASDTLYRVTPDGRASVFARDPRFAGGPIGMNGIAWHPAGYLLTINYTAGTLFRVPLRHPDRVTQVQQPRTLVGGDGIALHPDGSLVVVTNALGAPGTEAVTVLAPEHGWQSARVVRRTAPWPAPAPTTVAVTPYGDYILSGHIELLLQGTTSDEFSLNRR